jgi:hypothetical protein
MRRSSRLKTLEGRWLAGYVRTFGLGAQRTLAGRVRFPVQPVTAPGTDPGTAAAAVANPAGVRATNSLAGSTTDGPNKFNQLTPDGNLI